MGSNGGSGGDDDDHQFKCDVASHPPGNTAMAAANWSATATHCHSILLFLTVARGNFSPNLMTGYDFETLLDGITDMPIF